MRTNLKKLPPPSHVSWKDKSEHYLSTYTVSPVRWDTNSPKKRFLSEGSHLFECSLTFILLCWKMYAHYGANFFIFYFAGSGGGGARIYLWNFLGVWKWVYFFFLMSLAMGGGTMNVFFQYQQGNISPRRSKMDPKIDTFGQFVLQVVVVVVVVLESVFTSEIF